MAPMALSDSEVKTCSKACLKKNNETLKTQYDKLRIELNKYESDLYSYKKGLASVEERLVFYKKNERMLCDQIVVLKRDASFNELDINGLKKQVERFKKEKEDNQFKIDNFENASKSPDQLIANQISDKNKMGYGVKVDKCVSETSPVVVEKKTIVPTIPKVDIVRPKQQEKPVRKTVRYAEMYRSQKPRGNKRNWNNQKSHQLRSDFVKLVWNNSKRVNHHYSTRITHPNPKRNFVPKAVLMKTGMRPVNAAKPKAAYNAVKRNRFNAVKASACWVWMPKNRVVDHVSKNIREDMKNAHINEDHFCSDGCTGLREARVQQRKRRIQRRVQQKQKDQEDEVFGRILSAKKMKITAVGEKVNAAESLLVVSTEVNAD
ncbi:hypothetical protein Tco_0976939 [Tanacetum coccineum]|uniref:Uncharacterized protein n=1 Tax=Tanacetum coccineum TaxID=301880 RepID=A0ABQ5EJ56_9ASTR